MTPTDRLRVTALTTARWWASHAREFNTSPGVFREADFVAHLAERIARGIGQGNEYVCLRCVDSTTSPELISAARAAGIANPVFPNWALCRVKVGEVYVSVGYKSPAVQIFVEPPSTA